MPIGEDFLPDEGEGLTFDHTTKQLLLLYNHGARIVPGMPKGFLIKRSAKDSSMI